MLLGGHFHSGVPRLCLPCLPSRDATDVNALCVSVTNLSAPNNVLKMYIIISLICFFNKLNMMRNYYERLDDVFEIKIQLFMQSRIRTANFVNIDPFVFKLCCVK